MYARHQLCQSPASLFYHPDLETHQSCAARTIKSSRDAMIATGDRASVSLTSAARRLWRSGGGSRRSLCCVVARSTVFNCAVGPCISLPPSPRVLCAAAARLDAVHLHRLPRSFYAWSVCFLSQNVTCGGRVGWVERGSCRQGTQARMETAADAPAAAEPPATAVVCRAAFPAFAILAWHGQERADIFYTTTLPGTCTAGRPQAQTRREEGGKEGAESPQGGEGRGEEENFAMAGAPAITRSSSPVPECSPEFSPACSPSLR